MFLPIKNNLFRTGSYWKFKKWLSERPFFIFWATIFRWRYNANAQKKSFHLLVPTLPQFIRTLIYSAFIIFVLESFNYFVPVSIQFDKSSIDAFLTAVASICGVFLGLYFTAISSIAGNLLIRATQDIRRFFLASPKGQQYVKTVAMTGIISVFYIVTKSFGHVIHPVGLVFLAILAAYIIIRFWTVGSDVYNSLEPTDSFPWVTRDIYESIKGAVPTSFQWEKPYIQNHHRRLAASNLELTNNLVNFGIKELKISDEQLVVALKYIGGLLFAYSQNKDKIPTNSFWYKTKNQFESWSLASSTQIELALHTGTALNPKIIKDFTWFEEQNLDIVVDIFRHLIKENKVGSVFQGFEIFVEIAAVYGKDFDTEGLKMLFQKLEKVTDGMYSTETEDVHQQMFKEKLAFVESQGRLAISALLGFTKYLDSQSGDNLAEMISNIDWDSDRGIYLTGLPLAVLPRLESIVSNIKNERLIEGELISPEWYVRTLCIQQYLFSIQKYFSYIKSLHEEYFKPKFDKLLSQNQLPLSVHLVQRWLEFCNKYRRLVGVIKKQVDDCSRFHGVKDLPWVKFDFPNEEKIASEREKEVTDKMIQLLPKLQDLSLGSDLPDYFGQALTMGVEACYVTCRDNDPERFQSIFPVVFSASLAAYDITRKKVQDWNQDQSKIVFSTEPLVNLFEISGFAKLYSELYQDQRLWNIAKVLWDAYLSGENAKAIIQFISAIVNYRDSLFTIPPQATLRSGWQIQFNSKMHELGLRVFPGDRHIERGNSAHPSLLIRVVERWGGLMTLTAQEVFISMYLSDLPVTVDIEFPNRHEIQQQIQREQQRNQDNQDE